MFEKLHGPKRMLLSNGSDALFAPRPLIAERVRWFDRWLKGKPNGIDKEPAVTVWFDTHEQKLPSKGPSETVLAPLPKSPAIPPGIQLANAADSAAPETRLDFKISNLADSRRAVVYPVFDRRRQIGQSEAGHGEGERPALSTSIPPAQRWWPPMKRSVPRLRRSAPWPTEPGRCKRI